MAIDENAVIAKVQETVAALRADASAFRSPQALEKICALRVDVTKLPRVHCEKEQGAREEVDCSLGLIHQAIIKELDAVALESACKRADRSIAAWSKLSR